MIQNKARSEYLSEFIEKNSHDQRKLFKAVNSLLSEAKTLPLPDNCNPEAVANDIGNSFVQKVNDINKQLDNEEVRGR